MSEIYNKTNLTSLLSSYWFTIYGDVESFAVIYDISMTKLADYFTEAIRIGLSNFADEFAVVTKKKWHLFTVKDSDIVKIPGVTPDTDRWECPIPDNIKYSFFLTKNVLDFNDNYLHGNYFEIKNNKVVFYKHPSEFLNKDVVLGENIYWGWAYNTEIWDANTINKWTTLLSLYPVNDDRLKYAILGSLHFLVGGPTEKNLISLVTGCCGLPLVIKRQEVVFYSSKQEVSPGKYNYTIITDHNIYTINNISDNLVDESKMGSGTILKWGDVFTNIVKVYTSKDKLRRMIAGYFGGNIAAEGLELDKNATSDSRLFVKDNNVYLRMQYVGSQLTIGSLSSSIGADYNGRQGLIKIGLDDPTQYGMTLDAATHFIDECPSIIGISVHDDYKNLLNNFIMVLEEGKPSWSYIILSYGDRYEDKQKIKDIATVYAGTTNSDHMYIPDNIAKIGDEHAVGSYISYVPVDVTIDTSAIRFKNFATSFKGSSTAHALSGVNVTTGKKMIPGVQVYETRKNMGIFDREYNDIEKIFDLDYFSNTNTVVRKINKDYFVVGVFYGGETALLHIFRLSDYTRVGIKAIKFPGGAGQAPTRFDIAVLGDYDDPTMCVIWGDSWVRVGTMSLSDLLSPSVYNLTQLAEIDSWTFDPNIRGKFRIAWRRSTNTVYVIYYTYNAVTTYYHIKHAEVKISPLNVSVLDIVSDAVLPSEGLTLERIFVDISTKSSLYDSACAFIYTEGSEYYLVTAFVKNGSISSADIVTLSDSSYQASYILCSREIDSAISCVASNSAPYSVTRFLFYGTTKITSITDAAASSGADYSNMYFDFNYYNEDDQTFIVIPTNIDNNGEIHALMFDQSFLKLDKIKLVGGLGIQPRMFSTVIDNSLIAVVSSPGESTSKNIVRIPLEKTSIICIDGFNPGDTINIKAILFTEQTGKDIVYSSGGYELPRVMTPSSLVDFVVFKKI